MNFQHSDLGTVYFTAKCTILKHLSKVPLLAVQLYGLVGQGLVGEYINFYKAKFPVLVVKMIVKLVCWGSGQNTCFT